MSIDTQFNHNAATVLFRAITDSSVGTKFAWSLSNKLTIRSTSTSLPSLVASYAALPPGATYTVTVTVQTNSASGTANITITVPSAPTGGSCIVTPQTGYALNTSFLISCTGWTDDAGAVKASLGYAFSYVLAGREVFLGETQYASALSTQLPAPHGGGELILTARVIGANAMVAMVNSSVDVQINTVRCITQLSFH